MAAMATSAPASTAKVHIEIPGAQAKSEREPVSPWVDCGPVAELDALNCCPAYTARYPLTLAIVQELHREYVAHGHFRGDGCFLSDIYWHLATYLKVPIAGYIPYSDTPNYAHLHDFVKAHSLAKNPIVIEVVKAYNLPKNERGVEGHFVTLAGIDSDAGYKVLNGDTTDALTTSANIVPAYWATWATLQAADIRGAIAVHRIEPAAPVPPPPLATPPPVVSIGLADAITQAEALVAALKALVTP